MGLKLFFRAAALVPLIALIIGAWILRPVFVPNWSAAAVDSAATGNCDTSAHILSEVAIAGAGGVTETARQIYELGKCPNLDLKDLAEKSDNDGPTLFTFGGPVLDPEEDRPNRRSVLNRDWWAKQAAYITCWRRYDPGYRVDAARIERAVATATPDRPYKPDAARAACAKAQYDRTEAFLNSDNFTFEKGQVAYRLLVRSEKMGSPMAAFLRAKMLIVDEWRFRKVDHDALEPWDTLYETAKTGYFPAERMLAYELAERGKIGLPKEQTYLWLLRAWQSWEAYDHNLERKLRDYSRMLGKPFPPKDVDLEEVKKESEKLPLEHL